MGAEVAYGTAPMVIGCRVNGASYARLQAATRALDIGLPELIRQALTAYLGEAITAPKITTDAD